MKIALILIAALGLSGCMNLPPNSCESGNFTLKVGPFFSQDATLAGVSKQADGSLKVANFTGSTSYLGVITTTQTFHDLTIAAPATAK